MRTSTAALLLVMLVVVIRAPFVLAQAPAASKPPAGNVEEGRRLFTRMSCYYCHGTEGQGSSAGVGPRIALVPRSLDNFTQYVRRPTGRMTGYSETILPGAQMADIYAFLRSLPPVKPVAEIALLEQMRKR